MLSVSLVKLNSVSEAKLNVLPLNRTGWLNNRKKKNRTTKRITKPRSIRISVFFSFFVDDSKGPLKMNDHFTANILHKKRSLLNARDDPDFCTITCNGSAAKTFYIGRAFPLSLSSIVAVFCMGENAESSNGYIADELKGNLIWCD